MKEMSFLKLKILNIKKYQGEYYINFIYVVNTMPKEDIHIFFKKDFFHLVKLNVPFVNVREREYNRTTNLIYLPIYFIKIFETFSKVCNVMITYLHFT